MYLQKKFPFAILICFTLFTFFGCGKIESETDDSVGKISDSMKLVKGNFTGAAHPTSGEVFVYEENGELKLGFSNFKTDNGPDLRIYLAEDTKAKNYTELTSTVKNGTYSIGIPSGVDYTQKKYVLIWCKAFTVLFGSAELK